MSAQVTLDLPEYQKLANAKIESENRIAHLEKQIIEARLGDPGSEIREMAKLVRASVQITRFAMSNLSPEVIKNWPAEDLRYIGERLHVLPDHSADDDDLAREMCAFADEAARRDRARRVEGK